MQGSSVEARLHQLQPIGRACAIRALAACIPVPALCAPAVILPVGRAAEAAAEAEGGQPWHMLVDGLIEEAAAIARASAEAQVTFNSVAALTAGLERTAAVLQKAAALQVRPLSCAVSCMHACAGGVAMPSVSRPPFCAGASRQPRSTLHMGARPAYYVLP